MATDNSDEYRIVHMFVCRDLSCLDSRRETVVAIREREGRKEHEKNVKWGADDRASSHRERMKSRLGTAALWTRSAICEQQSDQAAMLRDNEATSKSDNDYNIFRPRI